MHGSFCSRFVETLMQIGIVVWHFNTLEKTIDSAICESINDRTDSSV